MPDDLEELVIKGQTELMIKELDQTAKGLTISGPMYMTTGMQIFDYREVHQKYDNDSTLTRSYNLPFCHTKIKSDATFWLSFSPILGFIWHTLATMSRCTSLRKNRPFRHLQ